MGDLRGEVAADRGRNGPDQRQQSTQSGALPATDNSQPTSRSTNRPEGAGGRDSRQLTGRRRRQSGRPERPSRPNRRPAKDTARPADKPPDMTGARHTTSNSIRHRKHHRLPQNEKGREARTGRDTRTFPRCRPGFRQARPPLAALALALPGGSPAGIPPAGGVPFVSLRRGALRIYPEPPPSL